MAELLFLTYDLNDACSFYRSVGIIKDLQGKIDHNITALQWGQAELDWSFISRFDIVMLQRPCTADSLALCNYIKACKNIKLWVDWDDDLFHVNFENDTFDQYAGLHDIMKGIIAIADVVTVPTEYLKQVISALNDNIVVIPNAFNDSLFIRGELPKRTNHIVWRGMGAHKADLYNVRNEIDKCRDEFLDWRFVFMGYKPWFLKEAQKIVRYEPLDPVVYFKTLFDLAPTCVHVPLNDNVFNRSKSNIAAIEGAFAGAVVIAPDWWNMPGTITYNSPETYYEALRSVLAGEVDKVAQNMMLWEYIQDCLSLSKINVQRVEVINSLL